MNTFSLGFQIKASLETFGLRKDSNSVLVAALYSSEVKEDESELTFQDLMARVQGAPADLAQLRYQCDLKSIRKVSHVFNHTCLVAQVNDDDLACVSCIYAVVQVGGRRNERNS